MRARFLPPAARATAIAVAVLFLAAACAPRSDEIGFIGDLTGKQSELGVSGRNGALLRLEEENARARVGGLRFRLVAEDDANSPDGFHAAVQDLVARKIGAVIGPYTSAIASLTAAETRLLFLSPTASAESLSGKDDMLLRLTGSSSGGARALAAKAASTYAARSASILFDSTNGIYADDFMKAFETSFAQAGGRVLARESYESSAQNVAFTPILQRLLSAHPSLLLVIANGSDTALVIRRAKQLMPQLLTVAAGWAATTDFLKYGGSAMDGTLFEEQFDPASTSPAYVAFVDAYRKRFGSAPSFSSLYSYDAAGILVAALSAGAKSPQEIKKRLLAMPRVEGLQSEFRFTATGDVERDNPIFVVRGQGYEALR
ncbi:MAG TPA: ABC transporter substrate-binding protein [Rectinemataceae bacterium]|nr:ABC transporter substrate-binding protein [Rectinemataceae bacterium]